MRAVERKSGVGEAEVAAREEIRRASARPSSRARGGIRGGARWCKQLWRLGDMRRRSEWEVARGIQLPIVSWYHYGPQSGAEIGAGQGMFFAGEVDIRCTCSCPPSTLMGVCMKSSRCKLQSEQAATFTSMRHGNAVCTG